MSEIPKVVPVPKEGRELLNSRFTAYADAVRIAALMLGIKDEWGEYVYSPTLGAFTLQEKPSTNEEPSAAADAESGVDIEGRRPRTP